MYKRQFTLSIVLLFFGLTVSGCSSFSRFDFPSFGLMSKEDPGTASLQDARRVYPPTEYQDRSYRAAPEAPSQPTYERSSPAYNPDQNITRSDLPNDVPSYPPRESAATDPGYGSQNNYSDTQPDYTYRPSPQTAPSYGSANGDTVTVQPGDTLYGLSRRYGVSVADIKNANNLSGSEIHVGQILVMSSSGAEYPSDTSYRRQPPRRVAKPRRIPRKVTPTFKVEEPDDIEESIAQPEIEKRTTRNEQFEEQKIASLSNEKQANEDTVVMPRTTGRFRWPVRGRIINKFGTKSKGVRNDGINISVPEGTKVKATEAGIVAYAGNELRGYGNLILIRHNGGWVSAYAHNSRLLVKRGQRIRRGQVIAKVGKTGSVAQPQLHFELRKDAKPVDPLKHM